ncbi:MAG: XdhC family protein [Betaproteobacteria bacterium]|nr:XdhC family protein [Betaproteobacteria bacterium]
MDSVDLSVLKTLHGWQTGPFPLWLVTVVETFGSSPRQKGAMLALRGDGLVVGSVSGGCIEGDLVRRAIQGQLKLDHCEVVMYGVTQEEAKNFGLPCGGALRLVIEPVRNPDWIGRVLQSIQSHQLVRRTVHLESMQVLLDNADRNEATTFDGEYLITVHGPRWRLLIIGASQTSSYLARMSQALDYHVTVCDPTETLHQTWDVPDTVLVSEMPDEVVLAFEVDPCTAIVALSHDPKLDDMALLEALKTPAFYIGALGSKANNMKRRARLALLGLTQEEIARLHGPVGLFTGSRTPPEIAVSVLAHMILIRNQSTEVNRVSKLSGNT